MQKKKAKGEGKKIKEIDYRSGIRKFITKNKSEVWGNKFDFKAISEQKAHD